jgi:glycolate oxidase iron-sulfur subunit
MDPDVWLHTGCVMNSWFRSVHRSTIALLEAGDVTVATPLSDGACCGALHLHAGIEQSARDLAERQMASMPGDAPIIVNSAGCGAMLKEYGELFDTPRAKAFSARVIDIHEWIDDNVLRLLSLDKEGFADRKGTAAVVVQEPCHLRNVQGVSVADVLEKFVPIRRLDDEGLCCGAGGAYSFVQPGLAGDIRDRKSQAIRKASGDVPTTVVTANPGCHLHLAADGHRVRSSVEVIAESLGLSV